MREPTMFPPDRHSLSAIDTALRRAHCSVCGPGTKIRWRSKGRGAECDQKPSRRLSDRGGRQRRKRREKYALTEAEYQALRTKQEDACAICGEVTKLCVDHCHDTGTVRGLLCGSCNLGIGMLRDDPERVRKALAYLEGGSP